MNIQVIGSGCKKCKALFGLTKTVAAELGITDVVEYSTDISRIVAMGAMSSPVLAIDGELVLAGVLPDKEKLTQVISEYLPA
jgi:small redox-active disulfide protein 2